jgi:hypothetical protein
MVESSSGKNDSSEFQNQLLSLWETVPHQSSRAALDLAQKCLSILKKKVLAPTGLALLCPGICMYFWDGRNYADLEISNDGRRITLCFNLVCGEEEKRDGEAGGSFPHRWEARGPRRLLEGYAVDPDEAGLRRAVRMILEHVDRTKTLKRH